MKILEKAKTSFDTKVEKLKKQVSELMIEVKNLNTSIKNTECTTMDGVFDAKHNMLYQIKLLAPNMDVSEVGTFKKEIDGKIVDII
ncbi:uncharacterized protein DS421_17g592810 [Arachis hypogaea]|nr:uncharacterized protein DS421_17g592810 [Arachis hypogaea]